MNKQYKIIKKHLKNAEFDDDVYVLNYRFPIFHFWKEYPVYFVNKDVLIDFIENSYIFNFSFWNIFNCSNAWRYRFVIHCRKKGFNIYLNPTTVLGYHILKNDFLHNFTIIETHFYDEAPRYHGGKLSEAYNEYLESVRIGMSKPLEEKVYELIENCSDESRNIT